LVDGVELLLGSVGELVLSFRVDLGVVFVISESSWVLGLELVDLSVLGSHLVVALQLSLWSSDDLLLSGIKLVVLDSESSLEEVKSDLVNSLALIESNLNSSVTSGDTSQVVNVEVSRNNVLHLGNILDSLLVHVGWQVGKVEIDDLSLGLVVVVAEWIVTLHVGSEMLQLSLLVCVL